MAIVKYKGFELYAKREKSLGGWSNLYYYIMRVSDGWFLADNFAEGADTTIKDYLEHLKETVDGYLENPSDWVDDDITL